MLIWEVSWTNILFSDLSFYFLRNNLRPKWRVSVKYRRRKLTYFTGFIFVTFFCKKMFSFSGNGGEIQWCFSQVKGTIEEDITEGSHLIFSLQWRKKWIILFQKNSFLILSSFFSERITVDQGSQFVMSFPMYQQLIIWHYFVLSFCSSIWYGISTGTPLLDLILLY